MSFRLLVSFLVGAAFFAILPIYAPFIVLQTEEMPRFLLGLGAGVVAGVVLALINGAAGGLRLVIACALVGASVYVFAYLVPTMFSEGEGFHWEYLFVVPGFLLYALAYLALPAAVGWALAVWGSSLLARQGRIVPQSARVPTAEADVSVPPPPRQPSAGEGVEASPSRQRRRNLAVLLLIGAIILASIVGFVSTLVMNLRITGGTVANNIGFSVTAGLSSLVSGTIIAILVMLLGGGIVYLLDRERRGSANTRITFLQAGLSWQVLVIAAGLVFLMSLSDVASVLIVQVEEPPSRP